MKRVFLVLAILASLSLFSCTADITPPGNSSPLSPSAWTIGTWIIRVDSNTISTLVFSNDNVVWTTTSVGFDFKQVSKTSGVTVSQLSSSDTAYSFSMESGGTTQTYTFTKTSGTTLRLTLNTGGIIQNLDYTKQ